MPAQHVLIVGAGAAGLMAAREIARAGTTVTLLEARDRIGGRILPLPQEEFGYRADGGAEFVHGAAPVTRHLLAEAGLSLTPDRGQRYHLRRGAPVDDDRGWEHEPHLHEALSTLDRDMPIADFLEQYFADPRYAALRRSVLRMVEGYDAADPGRASTFAVRDEWFDENGEQQGRVAQGYGALVDFLAAECGRLGARLALGQIVTAIEDDGDRLIVRCDDGTNHHADAVILTVPLPLLSTIALPKTVRRKTDAAADIGYGDVVKILLRFRSAFWRERFDDMFFLFAETKVPTWWTQYPAPHPVLTGWYAGPKAGTVKHLDAAALIEMGLTSLTEAFDRPMSQLRNELVAARAIDWGRDPFARGAYSYATPKTRAAQQALAAPDDTGIFFSGEALYAGIDMGTVEAALASGRDVAHAVLADGQGRTR